MQLDQHNLSPVLSYSRQSIEVSHPSLRRDATLHTQEAREPALVKRAGSQANYR